MPPGEFLIDVKVNLDSTSIASFARDVEKEIQRITLAARSESMSTGELSAQIGQVQTAAMQSLYGSQRAGTLGQDEFSRYKAEFAQLFNNFGSTMKELARPGTSIYSGMDRLPTVRESERDAQRFARQSPEVADLAVVQEAHARAEVARQKAREAALAAEENAVNTEYIESKRRAAIAGLQESAAIQESLAADNAYAEATVREAVARTDLATRHTLAEASSEAYIESSVRLATAQNALQAKITLEESGSDAYLRSTVQLDSAKSRLEARLNEERAASDAYVQNSTRAATAKQNLAARLDEERASSETYLQSSVRAATAKETLAGRLAAEQAASEEFVHASTVATIRKTQLQATLAEELAASRGYAVASTRTATAKASQDAAINESKAADTNYISATTRAATAKAALAAQQNRALAEDAVYIQVTAEAVRAKNQLAAAESVAARSEQNLAAAVNAQVEKARTQRATQLGVQQATTSGDIRQRAEVAVGEELLRAQQAIARSAVIEEMMAERGVNYAEVLGQAAAARKEEAAAVRRIEQEQLQRGNYVEDTAAANRAAAVTKERVGIEEARLELADRGLVASRGASDAEILAMQGVARRAEVEERRVRELLIQLGRTEEEVAQGAGIQGLMAQRKRLETELNNNIKRINNETAGEANQGGGGGGTWFQRVQQWMAQRQGRDGGREATDFQKGGQYLTSRLMSTAGFAITGGGVYRIVSQLREMVQEAERTQLAMARLQQQFRALGESEGSFRAYRDDIMGMARDLGIAGDQALEVGHIMRAAFTDSSEAVTATSEALKGMVVGGLSADQVRNLYVAIPTAFHMGREEIAGINDELLHLQDISGASFKEIADGVGQIAPLADELGLTFNQTAAIVATAVAATGVGAQQVSSMLGRAMTQIEQNAPKILQLFQQSGNPQLLGTLEQQLGTGQSGQALITIARHWQELDKTTQGYFLHLIGGRREFGALAGLLDNSGKLMAELDSNESHAGRTSQELAAIHATLSQRIKEAKEAFNQLGEALLRTGIGEVLSQIVHVAADLGSVIGFVLGLFSKFNEVTHGAVGEVLGLVIAYKALQLILQRTPLGAIAARILPRGARERLGIEGRQEGPIARGPATAIREAGIEAGREMNTSILAAGTDVARLWAQTIAEAGGVAGTEMGTDVTAAGGRAGEEMAAGTAAGGTTAATEMAAGAAAGGATRMFEGATAAQFLGPGVAGLGGAISGLAGTIGGLLVALAPIIAISAGQHIGSAIGGAIAQARAGEAPDTDVGVRTKAAGGIFGIGQHTEVTNQEEIAGAFSQRFQGMSLEQVRAIAEQHQAGVHVLGTDLTASLNPAQTTARNVEINAARQYLGQSLGAHGNKGFVQGVINTMEQQGLIGAGKASDLLKGIGDDNAETYKRVSELYNKHKNDPKFRAALQAVQAQQQAQNADLAAAQAGGADPNATPAQLEKLYKDGAITYDTMIAALRSQLRPLQAAVDAAKAAGKPVPPDIQKAYDDAKNAAGDAERQRHQDELDAANIREQANAGQDPVAQAAAAQAAAARSAAEAAKRDDPKAQAQAYADTKKANQDALKSQQDVQTSSLELQKQRLTNQHNEIAVADQEVRIAQQKLDNDRALGVGEAQLNQDEAALEAAQAGAVDARLKLVDAQAQLAQSRLAKSPAAQNRSKLTNAIAHVTALRNAGATEANSPELVQAEAAVVDMQTALADSLSAAADAADAVAESRAYKDPLAQANRKLATANRHLRELRDAGADVNDATYQQALQAQIDAQNDVTTQSENISKAHAGYVAELDKGNSLAYATDQLNEANRVLSTLIPGTAAWWDAMRDLLDKQRTVAEEQEKQAEIALNHIIAQANYRGDTPGADLAELQKLQQQLALAQRLGRTDQAAALQDQITNQMAKIRDDQLAKWQQDLNWQHDMGMLSDAAMIAAIRGYINAHQELTQQERQQLELQIHQLQNQAAQDLNWNIPTDIQLPTLYEARRLTQSNQQGMGYNDNRTIQVQYNVYSPQDHQAAVQDLASAVDGAPRAGVTPRVYPA